MNIINRVRLALRFVVEAADRFNTDHEVVVNFSTGKLTVDGKEI